MTNKEWQELADLLVPEKTPSLAELEKRYPLRQLPRQAWVTRIAPSPTGFPHFGFLYTAYINFRLARQTGGKFLLRIEDTDKKREVAGGRELIIATLKKMAIPVDEGPQKGGRYGPYIQSQRREIYLAVIKELIRRGFAYPCFCTPQELAAMRRQQQAQGIQPGYYGSWARCRHLGLVVIKKKLARGQKFVIRFRAPENASALKITDLIKGPLTFPANQIDYILYKSDEHGLTLPVYHLAATVDDHFQRISHVIRGEEWLSSLPLHWQIYQALGWRLPQFGHLAPVMKLDQGKKRKLSKRLDPEADARYYWRQGIPPVAIKAYILRLSDARFDDWRRAHPRQSLAHFPLQIKHLAHSRGPLFDMIKLQQLARDETHRLLLTNPRHVYRAILGWAQEFAPDFAAIFGRRPAYSLRVIQIEKESRKDISQWQDVPNVFAYFYDELYQPPNWKEDLPERVDLAMAKKILLAFQQKFSGRETAASWEKKMRQLAADLGYAARAADWRKSPAQYQGHVGDVATVIRLALTGRRQAPDLYQIAKILGWPRVIRRVNKNAFLPNAGKNRRKCGD